MTETALAKNIADKIAAGEVIHGSWEYGASLASEIARLLYLKGYTHDRTHSACSKASVEYHLKPGKQTPKGKRVEIISACFMGVFTQVTTWSN